jgi:aryl-phospho-beta-D-glucosidase BglC (GH1 family)
MTPDPNFLTLKGDRLINRAGETVTLRGFGLGGWMNMENFISGYPANEEGQRQAIREVLGEEKYEFFFDRFLEYFFTEPDAAFIQSLGLNLLRLPLNYRHFEDDMRPFEIKEAGFRHLDRVINLCAQHGIYTILDLHALPGCQNQDWHSDNATHKAFFWQHKHFQDRVVNLWETFARRYKNNPWVAGYNPINEPGDTTGQLIEPYYRRLFAAIRAVDPDHIIFLEGNRYSLDFHMFGDPLPNVVYTNHDYAEPGFIHGGPYPGETLGKYFDKEVLQEVFLAKSEYMLKHKTHIWVGEFGPVYTGRPDADAMRYAVLRDQLDIYRHYQTSWAIWLYKDIGLQAVVYVDPASPWMKRLRPLLEKKARLGADAWGSTDTHIRHVMEPLEKLFAAEFPDYNPFPFGVRWQIKRLVRHMLIAEALLPEFGDLFAGMTETQIDEVMQSFRFDKCVQRTELANILKDYAK